MEIDDVISFILKDLRKYCCSHSSELSVDELLVFCQIVLIFVVVITTEAQLVAGAGVTGSSTPSQNLTMGFLSFLTSAIANFTTIFTLNKHRPTLSDIYPL